MSEFWEGMTAAAEALLETAGETIHIGERQMQGVVQPVEVREVAVPGGKNIQVTHQIQVSLNDGDGVADGEKVESRLLQGAVASKVHFGGGWMILAGPANRWVEQDF